MIWQTLNSKLRFPRSGPFRPLLPYWENAKIFWQPLLGKLMLLLFASRVFISWYYPDVQKDAFGPFVMFFILLSSTDYGSRVKQAISAPFGICLPRHRQIAFLTGLLLGFVFAFLMSLPLFFSRQPAMGSAEIVAVMFCIGFFTWSFDFWQKIVASRPSLYLPFTVLYLCVVFKGQLAYSVVVAHPHSISSLLAAGSLLIWVDVFRREFRDDISRELPLYPGVFSETFDNLVAKMAAKEEKSSAIREKILCHMRRFGQFTLRRKILFSILMKPDWPNIRARVYTLLTLTALTIVLGYFHIAKILLFLNLLTVGFRSIRLPRRGVILQGRHERCRQVMINAFSATIHIAFTFAVICAVTNLLQPFMPAFALSGDRFTFRAVNFGWIIIPLVLSPFLMAVSRFFPFSRPQENVSLLLPAAIAAIAAIILNFLVAASPLFVASLAIPAWYFLAVMLERRFAKDDLVTSRENLMRLPI